MSDNGTAALSGFLFSHPAPEVTEPGIDAPEPANPPKPLDWSKMDTFPHYLYPGSKEADVKELGAVLCVVRQDQMFSSSTLLTSCLDPRRGEHLQLDLLAST